MEPAPEYNSLWKASTNRPDPCKAGKLGRVRELEDRPGPHASAWREGATSVMSDGNPTKSNMAGWTSTQAYVVAVVCLLMGIAGGYLIYGSSGKMATGHGTNPQPSASAGAGPSQMPPASAAAPPGPMTPQELQQALAQQVPPLLERLKNDPKNAKLLTDIGNMYFDAHQYNEATAYYGRALRIQPLNTTVRTDLGNAYWFLGNADRAIAEFQTTLKTAPNQANTLFNLGVVQWQGKMDAEAALATWQKLLDTNPAFPGRDRVVQMMAQARQHLGIQPGTQTANPAMQ